MRITAILPFLIFISCVYGACRKITRQENEYCDDLIKRCNISKDDFYKYNPNLKRDCSNLVPKQNVCCTSGGLSPSPDKDGRCAVHEVKPGDDCGVIGGQYGLTIEQIDKFNFKNSTNFGGTWGFRGCKNLQPGRICVSKGDKGPIPALQYDKEGNIVSCGPTASGNGTNVKCPLNSCCNEWGQCGLTDEFCKKVSGLNPGVKGCQDNCGMEYKPVGDGPKEFIKIGYYESWNQGWPCMNVKIDQLDLSEYTHIHYAFADMDAITMMPKMDKHASQQFEAFKSITGVKKVLSFGGWSISTDPGTLANLRTMVQPHNRVKAAKNLAKFADDNKLDGIDIDWEYPGADVSSGVKDDGGNYLEFLKALRNELSSSKTLSIAAPASYWYLRAFPIKEMSKVIDYIVYMTYDLHGQWDYGSKWTGEYLRSHVNWTETMDALTMISTKAGVPSNKILLGLASYGRSFQMADPNCYKPECKFTGDRETSNATPGKCTNTAGYISLMEIDGIRAEGRVRKEYTDVESQIILYDKDQWVAFNTDDQLLDRAQKARDMKLAGTLVWAADLKQRDVIALGCQPKLMTYDEVISGKCDMLPALIKWADELIEKIPGMKMDMVNKLFKADDRDYLVKQLKILRKKLQETKLAKREINGIISSSHRSLYRASMYGDLSYREYLGEIDPNEDLNKANQYLHAEIQDHPANTVIIYIDKTRIFKAETLRKWLNACDHWISKYIYKFNDVLGMLQKCVSDRDYNDNNIYNSIDWDPEDSTGVIVKTNPGTAFIYPSLPNNVCPAGLSLDVISTAKQITGGRAIEAKRKRKNKKTCDLPIYYINYYGRTNGVACNAFKYMLTRGQTEYSVGGDKPPRDQQDSFMKLYNSCGQGYQLDEFPMNGMLDGYAGLGDWDISVLCIDATENTSEGSNFNNFINAYSIWIKCDPDDPNSPDRGPLAHGDLFTVQIKNFNANKCRTDTKTPTLVSGVTVHPGFIRGESFFKRPGDSNIYYEIRNNFTRLTMP